MNFGSFNLGVGSTVMSFHSTGAAGAQHNPSSRMTVDFDIVFEGFFAANPNGHVGLMLRANMARIPAGPYQGHGAVFGTILPTSDNEAPDPAITRGLIETWGASDVQPGARFLFPRSASPLLHDHVLYRVSVQSTMLSNGRRYLRYSLHNAIIHKGAYDPLFDSGDVYDNNVHFDMSSESLVVFDASSEHLSAYNLRVTDLTVTWTPAYTSMPDMHSK